MHIAIDYTPALHQGAGIGRYTRELMAALARIDTDNQYILFCAGVEPGLQAPNLPELPANFTVRATRISPRWLTIGWHRLRLPWPAEQLTGECDVFHSPDFALPPLRRARGVVTVHDLSFLRVPQCAEPSLRAFLERAVPRALSRAAHVVADSANTRKDLIELLAIPPDKITVVPAGVSHHFRPVRNNLQLAEVRARYHLPQWFILSVGTLEPRKNFPRLISAFAQLRRHTGLPHELVIAGGEGWLFQDIYDRVAKEGLEGLVHFTGFVAEDDLPALYTLADLMVYPSLYEGFGLPPLEAMACGTPVVASNNSSLPETLGNAALLVDAEDTEAMADAMARVLGNANLRTRLSDLGRAQAARFTWENAARTLLAVYHKVMR